MGAGSEKKKQFPPVEEQLAYLKKGIVDLFTEEELRDRLQASRRSGRPLRVKVGFDPSAPDIHLGHTVLLRKMKHFQDMGHEVTFLIGDFTGLIGDPTGRSRTRPQLTRQEVLANAETYKEQAFRILSPTETKIRFNSEWLGELGAEGFIRLAAKYNVARMLERRDFRKRYAAGESIRMHEFLYPLVQAYDSVELRVDVELGGTDQLFNLNVGRDIMPDYNLPPQVVMTTPLLEGIDGSEKMSKSMGNTIGISESPGEIFGKVMSISDDLMWRYYLLCTDFSKAAIESMQEEVGKGTLHPRDAKVRLARELVSGFHGETAAREAEEEFQRIFTRGGVPEDVPEACLVEGPVLESGQGGHGWVIHLPVLLAAEGLAASRSAARRLLAQGAVSLDGRRVQEEHLEMEAGRLRQGILLKVGKRRYLRIRKA
ncbi:MAG: tyrosine--tRNA ligase [Acidobacteria bacterium]|nr:MAG: tyrosine--tRNA ligase [Acidobacteriota bacterium]